MPRSTHLVILLATLSTLGCGRRTEDLVTQPPGAVLVSPVVEAAGVTIRPASVQLALGENVVVVANVIPSIEGASWQGTVTWTNSDPLVADVSSGERAASIVGLRPGTTVVTATAGSRTASATVTILAPPIESARGPIVVDDFHVVEFQYPSAPGHWFYAPLLRLRDTTGVAAAVVTRLSFAIPGLGPSPACITDRALSSSPLDVFGETYGDYAFTIDQPGTRATAGLASAFITVRLGQSDTILLTATGPVVPGGLPTTYTGGTGAGCG